MTFNLSVEFQKAWDKLWENNLYNRRKYPKRSADTYHISATDLVRQVTFQFDSTHDYTKRLIIRGGALNAARDWLRSQEAKGILVSHNFGRGHISGQRFRPKGEPIGPTEMKTIEKKAKPYRAKPVHFSRNGGAMCVVETAKAKGKHIWSFRPSKAQTTNNKERVDCPRCLKLIAIECVAA